MRLSTFLIFPLMASLAACGGGGEAAPDPGSNGNHNVSSGSRAVPGYTVHVAHTDSVVTVQITAEAGQPMPIALATWRGGDEYVDPASPIEYTSQAHGSFTGKIPDGTGLVLWVRILFADGTQMIVGRDAFTL